MGLGANDHGARQIGRFEGVEGLQELGPARLPILEEPLPALGGRIDLELRVAMAIGLLAIAGQEVAPPRAHVAGHMFDQDRQTVGFTVEQCEELGFADLRQGVVREFLEAAEALSGVDKVEGLDRFHRLYLSRLDIWWADAYPRKRTSSVAGLAHAKGAYP